MHPDFHWPNIFATIFGEFHWQKFAKLACNLVLYICNQYLLWFYKRGKRGAIATLGQWNSQGNCDIFATIYFRKTDRKRWLRKYFVSLTRVTRIKIAEVWIQTRVLWCPADCITTITIHGWRKIYILKRLDNDEIVEKEVSNSFLSANRSKIKW